jgi:hypothetical protein
MKKTLGSIVLGEVLLCGRTIKPLGSDAPVTLFGFPDVKLPAWFVKYDWGLPPFVKEQRPFYYVNVSCQ